MGRPIKKYKMNNNCRVRIALAEQLSVEHIEKKMTFNQLINYLLENSIEIDPASMSLLNEIASKENLTPKELLKDMINNFAKRSKIS